MSEVIALISAKGGAGKTSIAVNLAHAYACCGLKVLLIDCDINTNGATAFYRRKENVKDQLNNCITFQEVLQSFLYPGIVKPHNAARIENGCIPVEDNLDFIPGGMYPAHGNLIENRVEERFDFLQESLARLIEKWVDKYEVLLMDQGAGYNPVIELMVSFATEIVFIREHDKISLDLTRDLFERISATGKQLVFCDNKIPKRDYKSIKDKSKEDILLYCTGFQNDDDFTKEMEEGRNIELLPESFENDTKDTGNGAALARIAKTVLKKYEITINEYLKNVEKEIKDEKARKAQRKKDLSRKLRRNCVGSFILGIIGGVGFYFIQDINFKLSLTAGVWSSIGIGTLILILSWILIYLYIQKKDEKYFDYVMDILEALRYD